jgi:hypothetical protein
LTRKQIVADNKQGIIIVALGICAPIMVVKVDWRFIYWLTSGLAVLSWVVLVLFTPETRWIRTAEELGVYDFEVLQTRAN